jgi:hypothetical protein
MFYIYVLKITEIQENDNICCFQGNNKEVRSQRYGSGKTFYHIPLVPFDFLSLVNLLVTLDQNYLNEKQPQ